MSRPQPLQRRDGAVGSSPARVARTDSQAAAILSHLQAGNSITPRDALQLFGCMRLAARIAELRERYSLPLRPVMVCDEVGQGMLL